MTVFFQILCIGGCVVAFVGPVFDVPIAAVFDRLSPRVREIYLLLNMPWNLRVILAAAVSFGLGHVLFPVG